VRGSRWTGTATSSCRITRVDAYLFSLPGCHVARNPEVCGPDHHPDQKHAWRRPAVDVEVYELPVASLGALLLTVAPPLAIGHVVLDDGVEALGFVCESYAAATSPDITAFGGWRDYLGPDLAVETLRRGLVGRECGMTCRRRTRRCCGRILSPGRQLSAGSAAAAPRVAPYHV
jgi:hypothetical protein